MPPDSRIPEILVRQLKRLRIRLQAVSLAEGLGTALFFTACMVAVGVLLDLVFHLPISVRTGTLLLTLAIGLGCLLRIGVIPALRRYPAAELATVVEAAHPELEERLLSVVSRFDVSRSDFPNAAPGSPSLENKLLAQTVEFATQNDFAAVVNPRRALRRCGFGATAWVTLLLPLLVASDVSAHLVTRFFTPWDPNAQNLLLTIAHPDNVIGRGDDLTIVVHAQPRFSHETVPEFAVLHWTPAGSTEQTRRLDWNPHTQTYTGRLSRVTSGFHYFVTAGSASTETHQIQVIDRPVMRQFVVDVVPPAYTGAPVKQHDPFLGEIQVLEQSHVELLMEFNKPVIAAELLWLGDSPSYRSESLENDDTVQGTPIRFRTPIPLLENGRFAELSHLASLESPAGRFVVRIQDASGLNSLSEPLRRLTVSPDLPPTLEFEDQSFPLEARPDDLLTLSLTASDDYGLHFLELHCDWIRNGERVSHVVRTPVRPQRVTELHHTFPLDLSPLQLPAGTSLTLRAKGFDERPVPGPNQSWSESRTIQIRADAKPVEDRTLAEQQRRMRQALEDLQATADQQRRLVRKHQYQSDAQKSEQGDENSRLEELAGRIDDLAEQGKQLRSILEEHPVFEHLADQLQDLSDSTLQSAANTVQQARTAEESRRRQLLSSAADQLQKSEKQLTSLKSELQQIAQTQRELLDLNRIADQIDRLATDVESLYATSRDAPQTQPDLEQRRQQLIERHRSTLQALNTLLDQQPALIEKARELLQLRMGDLADQAERLARQQPAFNQPVTTPAPDSTNVASDASPAMSPSDQTDWMSLPEQLQAQLQQARGFSSEIRQLGLKDPRILQRANLQTDAIRQSAEALLQFQFSRSADTAEKGVEFSRQFSAELALPEAPDLQKRLEQRTLEFAAARQALARTLRQLADSPTAQHLFRTQIHEDTSRKTSELALELEQRANDFQLKRINRPAQGELARQAGQLTRQAEQAQHSEENSEAGRNRQRAAEALRRAAHLTRQASEGANPNRRPDSETPGDVGRQVAVSSQKLEEAGQLLSQLPFPEERTDQPQPSDAPAQATATTLRQAALGLRHAAVQMGISRRSPPQRTSLSQQSGGESLHSDTNDAGHLPFLEDLHLQTLEQVSEKRSGQNWGQLPGSLRTEMLESGKRQQDPEYAPLIRRYFDDISRTRSAELR